MFLIRDMTYEDYWVIPMMAGAAAAEGLPFFKEDEFDHDCARDTFGDALEGGISVIAINDNEPIGFILANTAVHPITGLVLADISAWYVIPSARKTGAGPILLRAYLGWCDELLVMPTINVSSGKRTKAIGRMIERLGFRAIGATYLPESYCG